MNPFEPPPGFAGAGPPQPPPGDQQVYASPPQHGPPTSGWVSTEGGALAPAGPEGDGGGGGSKKWLIAGIAAACVVLLGVVGGVVVWWSSGSSADSTATAPVAGQLAHQFPAAPSADWTLTPLEVGGAGFVSLDPARAQYRVVGSAHDDSTIVTLVRADADRGGRLLGIDADSGEHWITDRTMNACSAEIVDGRIACYDSSSVYFIDTSTGVIAAAVPSEDVRQAFGIGFDGHAAYVRNYIGGTHFVQVTPEGVGWRQSYPDGESLPSGDASQVLTTGSLFGSAAGRVLIVSTEDGQVLVDRPGYTGMRALPDGSIAFVSGSASGATEQGPVVVVGPDGQVREFAGSVVAVPQVAADSYRDVVFVDGSPLRLSDGTSAWSGGSPLPGADQVPYADAVRVVLADTRSSTFVVADAGTGATVFEGEFGRGDDSRSPLVTDGERLIASDENGQILAYDLVAGTVLWTVPTAETSADRTAVALAAVGSDLVAVHGQAIIGFGPTGPASRGPGSASTGSADGGDGEGSDEYVTRCGTTPVFTPETFQTNADGLMVRMKVTATCPDGDVLSGSSTGIIISDDAGLIASGLFDFRTTPLVLGPGQGADDGSASTVDLTFPVGSFLRLPDTLDVDGGASSSSRRYLVNCERGPQDGPDSAPVASASQPQQATASGAGPEGPADGRNFADALRLQADADRSFIESNLDNRWVAQLSSKQPGLNAEGRIWTEQAILEEFLALRLRFDDVRLLYSDEWPVFSYRGWWVTVAARTFSGPEAANDWCRAQGFGPDNCFAKLISTTADSEGSTRYWK